MHFRDKAEELVIRDESDETRKHGQRLRQAFGMSDVFLDAGDAKRLSHDLDRFLDLLFGKPVITPTKDEVGMAHAYLAAMRSSELGRQVGAAICDQQGNLIAIGTNEKTKYPNLVDITGMETTRMGGIGHVDMTVLIGSKRLASASCSRRSRIMGFCQRL